MTQRQFKDYIIAKLIQDIRFFDAAYFTDLMNEVFIEEISIFKYEKLFEHAFEQFKQGEEYVIDSTFEEFYTNVLFIVADELERKRNMGV